MENECRIASVLQGLFDPYLPFTKKTTSIDECFIVYLTLLKDIDFLSSSSNGEQEDRNQ